MKHSISDKLLKNYILMFLISTVLVLLAYFLLLAADGMLSKKLVSRTYTAEALMRDDYTAIKLDEVVKNNGSVLVVTKDLEVINLAGEPVIKNHKLTAKEWSDFLVASQRKDNKYNYSIKYNESSNFWLVVTFPVSLRIYFGIVTNGDTMSTDFNRVLLILGSILLIYIIMLTISTLIYSKISAVNFVKPLQALCSSTKNLAMGNYNERVELHLTAEFAELEGNFNALASELEKQKSLREQSENLRRQLILDVSHDLKNPLASIQGYSELALQDSFINVQQKKYLQAIFNNSVRANELITDLFELSKFDSADFSLDLVATDICEFLREKISDALPLLQDAGFQWKFDIPENDIMAKIDYKHMDRVLLNLFTNAVKYNPAGTKVTVSLYKETNKVIILLADNGVGIEKTLVEEIFNPFVRADRSRNSKTGGSGLGLAIVKKIVEAHGGRITLESDKDLGCNFEISLPL